MIYSFSRTSRCLCDLSDGWYRTYQVYDVKMLITGTVAAVSLFHLLLTMKLQNSHTRGHTLTCNWQLFFVIRPITLCIFTAFSLYSKFQTRVIQHRLFAIKIVIKALAYY